MTDLVTIISDERLQRMIHDAIDEGESDNLVSALTELQSLRAQGGVRVSPALLQGVFDSLRAAIYEYEDRDVFPGARSIMEAQLAASQQREGSDHD